MNEWQQKAKQRAEEFAEILEAIAVELPGEWKLKPEPELDSFARWRQIECQDRHRSFICGTYQASGKERIEFKASGWPGYIDESGNNHAKDPSNTWNPKEVRPVCTAAIDREPRLIAKQIARLLPDYDRIYERCEAIAKEAQEYHNRAGSILKRLAEATGNPFKPERQGRGFYLQELPGDIVSVEYRSPGDVKIGLDGEEMLKVIELVYQLRQGGQGSDGSAKGHTVAELQTVIDAGIEAIQKIVDNWESGDLAGAVNGGEDWATQAGDYVEPQPPYWACPECGCTDVHGTAWIELNTDKLTGDEPPTSGMWCPQCDLNGREGYFEKGLEQTDELRPLKEESDVRLHSE